MKSLYISILFLFTFSITQAQWYLQNSGTTNNLQGVSFSDANNGTAVGDNGTILRTSNSIQLTAPNGGENWIVGSTRNITWTSSSSLPNIVLEFNGITDYLLLPSSPSLTSFTNQITIEAWVKINSSGTGGNIITSGNENEYALAVMPNGKIIVTMVNVNPQLNHAFIGKSSLTPNTWYHVAFTYNGSIESILINGEVDTSFSTSGNISSSMYSENISIGAYSYNNNSQHTSFLDGILDEVRIWNIGRTTTEIQATMNSEISGTEENLMGYWRFNGNVLDLSAYTNNASIFGNPTFLMNSTFVKLDYTTNNGTSWTQIIASTPASSGSYSWTIPNTPSTQCIVRISDVINSSLFDISDNTFTISNTTFQITVSIQDGWNMVSIPGLHPVNQDVTTWWLGKDPSANVFEFNGGYNQVTTLTPGKSYWMMHLGDRTYSTGDEWPAEGILVVPHNALNATTGWNLIGGYEHNAAVSGITTTPLGLQDSPFYGYTSSGGYQIANFLIPGYGYWILLSGSGLINLPNALAKETSTFADYIKEDWGKIIITDNSGKSYTLYTIKGEVNLNKYQLPPSPPEGMFDVRYGSGRLAEDLSSGVQSIDMQGIKYPINVRTENVSIRLQDASGGGLNERLKSGEEVVISNSSISKLIVSGEVIPDKYALEQNYPNPFNPSTKIEFSIPEDVNNVTLTIYNTLGQKVAELVNSKLEAGKYSYVWNASDVATGLYIYELRTDKFVSVKKMMLLK